MIHEDWKTTPVFMMDFEGSPTSGVIEFGVVGLSGGSIQMAETALCRPVGTISERDREVHGLGEHETRGQRPFSDQYARFVGLRREGVFAAHNRHAENSFIKNTWPLPPAVPDWRGGGSIAQEWGPWIDTLSIYRTLYPGLESYGLTDLVDRFACQDVLATAAQRHCPADRRKPHCALYDALASAILLLRLERVDGLAGSMNLAWLLRLSEGWDPQGELF